jgi:hypothetical protein
MSREMCIRLEMRRKCWQRRLHVRGRAASQGVRGHLGIERPKRPLPLTEYFLLSRERIASSNIVRLPFYLNIGKRRGSPEFPPCDVTSPVTAKRGMVT